MTRRDFINFLDSVKRDAPVQANRIQTIVCTCTTGALRRSCLRRTPSPD